MAGARIEIDVDDAAVTSVLQQAGARLTPSGMHTLLSDIGEYLVRSTRERAEAELSPDGVTWQALSPAYAHWKERKRPGAKILHFDFHMLGDQLSAQVEDDVLRVGTNAPYGAIHQFGGDIKRAARKQEMYFHQDARSGEVGNRFVKKSKSNFAQTADVAARTDTMPARPWLGVSDADRAEIKELTLDYLRSAFAAE